MSSPETWRIAFENRLLRDPNQRGGLNASRTDYRHAAAPPPTPRRSPRAILNVPSNGKFGGQNASMWKAECAKGMVMTGIEIVVGGTCHNQCNIDGRPVATYGIHCSQLQAGSSSR